MDSIVFKEFAISSSQAETRTEITNIPNRRTQWKNDPYGHLVCFLEFSITQEEFDALHPNGIFNGDPGESGYPEKGDGETPAERLKRGILMALTNNVGQSAPPRARGISLTAWKDNSIKGMAGRVSVRFDGCLLRDLEAAGANIRGFENHLDLTSPRTGALTQLRQPTI